MPIPIPTIPVTFGPHEADWWMVGLTGAGVIATLTIAWFTLRANQKADRAQITATQAYAEALDATHRASAQQIEALEALVARINTTDTAPSIATPAPPRVRWELQRDQGRGKWLLRHVGSETAKHALLSPLTKQDRADLMIPMVQEISLPPGGTLPFSIARSLASPPATLVEVSWQDDDGEHSETFVVGT